MNPFLRRSVGAALLCLLGIAPASAQMRTAYVLPDLSLGTPRLAASASGIAQNSFTDVLAGAALPDITNPGAGPQDYHVAAVQWHDRGDKACLVRVWFENLAASAPSISADVNVCAGNARNGQIASFDDPTLVRGGYPVSIGVCLRNGRLKGVSAQIAEVTGTETLIQQNPYLRVVRVDPFAPAYASAANVVVAMTSREGRLTPSSLSAWRLRAPFARTARCRTTNVDWQPLARCNRENVELTRVVSGLRVHYNGNTITGLQPFCSDLIKAR